MQSIVFSFQVPLIVTTILQLTILTHLFFFMACQAWAKSKEWNRKMEVTWKENPLLKSYIREECSRYQSLLHDESKIISWKMWQRSKQVCKRNLNYRGNGFTWNWLGYPANNVFGNSCSLYYIVLDFFSFQTDLRELDLANFLYLPPSLYFTVNCGGKNQLQRHSSCMNSIVAL